MSNYLVHYGVKGMKWGVRRYEEVGGKDVYKRNRATAKANYKAAMENYKQTARAAGYNFKGDDRAKINAAYGKAITAFAEYNASKKKN